MNESLSPDERYDVYAKIVRENKLNTKGFMFENLVLPEGKSGVIDVKVYAVLSENDDLVEKAMITAFSSYGTFSIEKESG